LKCKRHGKVGTRPGEGATAEMFYPTTIGDKDCSSHD